MRTTSNQYQPNIRQIADVPDSKSGPRKTLWVSHLQYWRLEVNRARAITRPSLNFTHAGDDAGPLAARGRVLTWGAATESKSPLITVEPRM
jgi:hypothetical protein